MAHQVSRRCARPTGPAANKRGWHKRNRVSDLQERPVRASALRRTRHQHSQPAYLPHAALCALLGPETLHAQALQARYLIKASDVCVFAP